ncbi:hypothetical protein V1264_017897 [Littorina saxatilis]|uniref:Uncharacterized protein n=2 Tax=Littorina saxatilis TaxID=31220 RepID=A0AAN9G9P6_9CAEN
MPVKKKKVAEKLRRRYYESQLPGSLGGVEALRRTTRQEQKQVEKWLTFQDTYTLHKPVRRKFTRRRIIVGGIDHQWQADLIDVRALRKDNDGFTYLLTCIDVLSKHAWVVPLKDKTGASLVTAFKSIFVRGRQPLRLQTDKGSEFKNKVFQDFLDKTKVHFFVTENDDIKASMAERFNRTLKDKLWRYFTRTSSVRYVEVLAKLVRGYNHSYHRSIKKAPADVTIANQEEVWQRLYGGPTLSKPPKLNIGDRVRISKTRRVFKKGYMPSWTEELFTISQVKTTTPVTYVLKDDHGEELLGTFYEQELQKVGEKEIYRIEAVLEQRPGKGKQKEYLVKWLGYDPSFNSWIPQTALTPYTD